MSKIIQSCRLDERCRAGPLGQTELMDHPSPHGKSSACHAALASPGCEPNIPSTPDSLGQVLHTAQVLDWSEQELDLACGGPTDLPVLASWIQCPLCLVQDYATQSANSGTWAVCCSHPKPAGTGIMCQSGSHMQMRPRLHERLIQHLLHESTERHRG